jgi:hypothetical protein
MQIADGQASTDAFREESHWLFLMNGNPRWAVPARVGIEDQSFLAGTNCDPFQIAGTEEPFGLEIVACTPALPGARPLFVVPVVPLESVNQLIGKFSFSLCTRSRPPARGGGTINAASKDIRTNKKKSRTKDITN